MSDFSELTDFLDDDGFDTPKIPSKKHREGKQYHIPSPDAETGLFLSALIDLSFKQQSGIPITPEDQERLTIKTKDEKDFSRRVLSDEVVDEMIEDGVRWQHLQRITQYAFIFFAIGKDAAALAVENGLFKGKALTPTLPHP